MVIPTKSKVFRFTLYYNILSINSTDFSKHIFHMESLVFSLTFKAVNDIILITTISKENST